MAVGRARDRDVIVSGSEDGTVRVWDAATGQPVGPPLTGHTGPVTRGGGGPGRGPRRDRLRRRGPTVRVWDAATGQPVGLPLTGHTGPVRAVAVGRAAGTAT